MSAMWLNSSIHVLWAEATKHTLYCVSTVFYITDFIYAMSIRSLVLWNDMHCMNPITCHIASEYEAWYLK